MTKGGSSGTALDGPRKEENSDAIAARACVVCHCSHLPDPGVVVFISSRLTSWAWTYHCSAQSCKRIKPSLHIQRLPSRRVGEQRTKNEKSLLLSLAAINFPVYLGRVRHLCFKEVFSIFSAS